jgi:ABC-type Mn2+/Zn2+ transport system permease subunit
VTALQVVGIALMLAMFVTPAATASLITRRLPAMMAASALIGAFSGIAGVYASFHLNVASGAAVVLVATSIFALVFLFAPRRGLVWRRA